MLESDGRWLDEEEVQKERRASRVREAALCLDIMKNTKQILATKERIEHTGAEVPSAGRRTAATGTVAIPGNEGGKRRFGSAVFPGWIGVFPTFSHLIFIL